MSSSSSFPTCDVQTDFEVPFLRPPYVTTVILERVEDVARFQRFDNPNWKDNVAVLFDTSATRDEQQDYLTGVLWSSFALLMVGLLWLLLLTCCKLAGPQRVGFWSARRLKPERPQEPLEALAKKEAIAVHGPGSGGGGVPFQHNGIASGYNDDAPPSPSSRMAASITRAPHKIVKGTIKAPKRVLNKARKQKRRLEQQFSKTKKFERIQSGHDFDIGNDILEEEEDDDEEEHDDEHEHEHDDDERSHSHSQQHEPPDSFQNSAVLLLTQEDERDIAQYEAAMADYYTVCERRNARMRRVRAAAGVCAAGVVVAAVLFLVYGTTSLARATQVMRNGIGRIQASTRQASATVEAFVELSHQSSRATTKFMGSLDDGLCPARGPFCTTATSTTLTGAPPNATRRTCDFGALQSRFDADHADALDKLWNYLDGTLDLVLGDGIAELQTDLRQWQDYMMQADQHLRQFDWAFWTSAGCNLASATICLALLVAVLVLYFGHPLARYFKCLRSWLLVPLLLILTVLGWCFTTVFVTMSLGTSDACINAPDETVLMILQSLRADGHLAGDTVGGFMEYFVNGCSASATPPQELDQKIVILKQLILPAMQNVQEAIATAPIGQEALEAYCGNENSLGPFAQMVDAMAGQLCTLTESLAAVRVEFQCAEWYPLYEEVAYQGTCNHAMTGFVWAASTQLAMVILTMILLTLRVAYYELDEVAEASSGSCCSDWCCSTVNQDSGADSDDREDGDGYAEKGEKRNVSARTEATSLEDS